jgi:hypothetical protein
MSFNKVDDQTLNVTQLMCLTKQAIGDEHLSYYFCNRQYCLNTKGVKVGTFILISKSDFEFFVGQKHNTCIDIAKGFQHRIKPCHSLIKLLWMLLALFILNTRYYLMLRTFLPCICPLCSSLILCVKKMKHTKVCKLILLDFQTFNLQMSLC